MTLAFEPRSIFEQRDVRETPSPSASASSTIIAPIGTILPWLKSYTNTPQALPTGWVECDGSVLSDSESVYDGQALPDLNGGEFIRGSTTSGGTGGQATIDNHTDLVLNNENSHTHTGTASGTTGTQSEVIISYTSGSSTKYFTQEHSHSFSDGFTTSGGSNHTHTFSQNIDAHSTNLPPYYNVVWIIRVK